ncbi:BNR-4 repeat-containing protein [Parapedobacter sp. DT-150]|uniref:BNR-4 repeat-containing protein n=1 Tax=Parapedobacter sp. DT-150 TaxID=3396162 RepID=UPI003F19E9F0
MSRRYWLISLITIAALPVFAQSDQAIYGKARLINQQDIGYRGIWYNIGGAGQRGPVTNEYKYKYSGGLGTYPSNHYPFSVYVEKVDKTFFCYGGTDEAGETLYHMVSYYDHRTGEVPKPFIVLDKATDDAHDNPVIQVDKNGYIWIFSASHGTGRPSFIHRSKRPYDIMGFERVDATKEVNGHKVPLDNFSYLQVYYSDKSGFTALFTHYEQQGGRVIAWMTSADGVNWSAWKDLSLLDEGQYQTSGQQGERIGTAFNYHPTRPVRGGLDFRTNLYYLQTNDFGKTWQTVDRQHIDLPLTAVNNPALIHDYDNEQRNVYICDVNFDAKGRPVILYLTSKGPMPGPEDGPRTWHTAYWTGKKWQIRPFTESTNNYDMGSMYVEGNTWTVIAPTESGPQPYNTGGEMVLWQSKNKGKSWTKVKQLTQNSAFNHTYARRPVNVHPDFYAFWADGHGRAPSESRLYFADKAGKVYQLPAVMDAPTAKPEEVKPIMDETAIGVSGQSN